MLLAFTFPKLSKYSRSISKETHGSPHLCLRVPRHFTKQPASINRQGSSIQGSERNRAATWMLPERRHEGAPCGYPSLHALSKNRCLNLEESCMITQFTGKIIKSLVSFLFHYTGCSSPVLPLWTRGRILWLALWQRRQGSPTRCGCVYPLRVCVPNFRAALTRSRNGGAPWPGEDTLLQMGLDSAKRLCQRPSGEIYIQIPQQQVLKILNHIKYKTNFENHQMSQPRKQMHIF